MDQTTQETGAADDNRPDKIGDAYHQSLSCRMTPDERKEREERLLKLLDLIDSETEAMDAAKKKAKARIEGHEADIKQLRIELGSGLIDKPVKVEEHFYYRIGLVKIVRADTGAVTDERAMTTDERMPKLPFATNGHGDDSDDEDEFAHDEDSDDGDDPPTDEPQLATSKPTRGRKKS